MLAEQLKKSILQAAIQGKLTDQRKEDGNAQDLYDQIQEEKQRLIKEKKIKKEKPLPVITEDEIPFEIPENWMWVRISDLFDVARGGSPRPIKSFLTDDPNGVNWIKIGDTEIDGKYINHVREKIKPEGVKKSRFVRSGDLLLTNSMSYSRPYILKTDGCIHDGWLMLSPILRSLNKEFFYYLSSSQYMKQEFTKVASGAVVKNLNKDKVKAISIPLPPLAEQKRIADEMRRAELARITGAPQVQSGQVGKTTGTPGTRVRNVTGTASAEYAASVIACIRPHIFYAVPPGIERGQHQAVYRVNLLPNGEQAGNPVQLKSSGLPAYDHAVETAIRRCKPFPRPKDQKATVPRSMQITFDPVDDNANN